VIDIASPFDAKTAAKLTAASTLIHHAETARSVGEGRELLLLAKQHLDDAVKALATLAEIETATAGGRDVAEG